MCVRTSLRKGPCDTCKISSQLSSSFFRDHGIVHFVSVLPTSENENTNLENPFLSLVMTQSVDPQFIAEVGHGRQTESV